MSIDRTVLLNAQVGNFQPDGAWVWGSPGTNLPGQILVLNHPEERIIKIVPFGGTARTVSSVKPPASLPYLYTASFMALTATGNVYAPENQFVTGRMFLEPLDHLDGFPPRSDLADGLPQGSFVDIDSSAKASFALDTEGQLWAWASPSDFTGDTGLASFQTPAPTTPAVTLTNVAQFTAGSTFCIAQKKDGTWWATGSGDGQDGLAARIVDGTLDGTFLGGDSNLWSQTVAMAWTEVPSLEALDTVKVVASGGTEVTLFVQRDGTVWAAGGQADFFSETNVTGIFYGQYISFCGFSGPFLGVHVDPRAYYPAQIPWATNIVDASTADEYALYLTSNGVVYFVCGNVNVGTEWAILAADGSVSVPNPGPTGPDFPPALLFPPGITGAALLPGGGAIIGSDGRLYTVGATPDGSVRPEDLPAYNLAVEAGLPPPFSLDGTHFNEMPNFGSVFSRFFAAGPTDPVTGATSLADPQPPWAGFPPPLLSRSGLANNIPGGFTQWGFRVLTITSGSSSTLTPAISLVVALFAVFRKGGALIWSRVAGPV